uniref:Protein SDA1 n=1 Tax=Ditylenchus dipsaci TaxID=166011 RepID=A0A915DZJ7_9BILA
MMQTSCQKRLVTAMQVMPVFFELVNYDDKQLRKFILGSIISLVKSTKGGSKKKMERKASASRKRIAVWWILEMVGGSHSRQNQLAANICVHSTQRFPVNVCSHCSDGACGGLSQGLLERCQNSNVLAMDCVFHKVRRIQISTMKFFLGSIEDEEGLVGDSDSEGEGNDKKDDAQTLRDVTSSIRYGKKTRKGRSN